MMKIILKGFVLGVIGVGIVWEINVKETQNERGTKMKDEEVEKLILKNIEEMKEPMFEIIESAMRTGYYIGKKEEHPPTAGIRSEDCQCLMRRNIVLL